MDRWQSIPLNGSVRHLINKKLQFCENKFVQKLHLFGFGYQENMLNFLLKILRYEKFLEHFYF